MLNLRRTSVQGSAHTIPVCWAASVSQVSVEIPARFVWSSSSSSFKINNKNKKKRPLAAALLPTWWPSIAQGIIDSVLRPSIPNEETGLVTFGEQMGPATAEFENELVQMGTCGWYCVDWIYLTTSFSFYTFFLRRKGLCPDDDRKLTKWTRTIHVHFWAKRRAAALGMARDLLAAAGHNTVQVTDATERGEERGRKSSHTTHQHETTCHWLLILLFWLLIVLFYLSHFFSISSLDLKT